MLSRFVKAATLAVVLGTTALVAQQPAQPAADTAGPQAPVTFKLEVNYVEVDASVTDAQGNLVPHLTRNDFQILEDGKRQAIATFAAVNLPIERDERPPFLDTAVEPDVRSNEREFDGRLFVIVLDDLHTFFQRTPRVRAAARRFVERHMGANDLAAVIHTGRTDAGQELTASRRMLLASIDRFAGKKLRSPTLERVNEYNRTRDRRDGGQRVADPLDAERGFQARNSLEIVRSVSEWLGGIHGRRKALVLFSEGIDYDMYDVFNAGSASTVLAEARNTIGAATRSNVSIYAVDPRGLTADGDLGIEVGSYPDDPATGISSTSLAAERRLAQDSLRVLSDETGGFAALNSNDFTKAFERIMRENSSYYLLGYYPTNDKRDGKLRKIDVRVTRPGLTVRARKGYVAPRGKPASRTEAAPGTPAELMDAMESPMPLNGVGLVVFAAPFKGTEKGASVVVTVQVSGRDFRFVEKNGKSEDKLVVSVAALGIDGKIRDGDHQSADLKVSPELRDAVLRDGLRMITRLTLVPGRYQIRAAARAGGAGRTGSVHHDLEVPDFDKSDLTMSGILLTSASARKTPTPRMDEQLKQLLPGPPTTEREFTAADELAVFVDVYDRVPSLPHKVDIKTTVLADDGRAAFSTADERDSSELGGTKGGYGHATRIPLRGFAPGLYVLRVEARSRAGEGLTTMRQLQFRVRNP